MADPFNNQGGTLYVCETPQNSDLTEAGFKALTWVKISNVGEMPELGVSTNTVSYDTTETIVSKQDKGVSTAGSGTFACAHDPEDAGQLVLREIGHPTDKNNYAFARVSADPEKTTFFYRGKVAGPVTSGGGVEDFVVDTYSIMGNQVPVQTVGGVTGA